MTPTPASNRLKRMLLATSLLGLSAPALARAAPVLPTGGKVVSGAAAIGPAGSAGLTITQSSGKAIIDWNGFSIGQGGKVQFDNGKGATLNRVTGGSVSAIDGLLGATGSVYVINPNGVIIGETGVVNVGGTFVASTLDVSNADFLSGGALGFSGPSTASVINLGKVGALGGDVALIGATVENDGAISAANGSAGLIAGHSVVWLRDASLDEGRFSVLLGGAGTSATNAGAIQAAAAELRAEGGNVYALAGDTSGVIRATGVKSGGGKIWLTAEGGTATVDGTLEAQGPGGTPGAIETSAGVVALAPKVDIDSHGGTWLLDPYDVTISTAPDTAGSPGSAPTQTTNVNTTTLDNALADNSVVISTGAAGSAGSDAGNITVAAPVAWSTGASLTLTAANAIAVNAPITIGGAGQLALNTGTVAVGSSTLPLLSFAQGAAVSFTGSEGSGQALSINGTGYALVFSMAELAALNNTSGDDALAVSLTPTMTYKSSVIDTFSGTLDGLGHTITGLTINDSGGYEVGLVGNLTRSATVRDLGLLGVDINGSQLVGGLAGGNEGTISQSYVTGVVGGTENIDGGLVAQNNGTIAQSYANVAVSGLDEVGGLVGQNGATIVASYASGPVVGSGRPIGGLVGQNLGSIAQSYATGAVGGSSGAGGLVGENDRTITTSYFDTQTTGQSSGVGFQQPGGGTPTGLTTAQFQSGSASGLGSAFAGGIGGLYPYLANFFPNGVQAVSGVAYSDAAGTAPLASTSAGAVTVSLDGGGAQIGQASTGANGYYYVAVPAGTLASGEAVLASTPAVTAAGATDSATLALSTGAGAQAGLNLYPSTLTIQTAETLLSTSPTFATAIAAAGADAGAAAVVNGTTGIGYDALGSSFTIDQAVSTSGGFSVATGSGDPLAVSAPISLGSGGALSLLSGGALAVDAPISVDGSAPVTLAYDASSPTNLSFAEGAGLNFANADGSAATAPVAGQSLTVNGTAYTLVYTKAELNGIDAANNGTGAAQYGAGLAGAYALASSLVLAGTTYTQAPIASAEGTTFSGILEGLGHTLTGLTLSASGADNVGLIGISFGTVRDLGLLNGTVIGSSYVGALAGRNYGTIVQTYATGAVSGTNPVGGLVGLNGGAIAQAYATGAVSGQRNVGGFVGVNGGAITQAYATGAVSGQVNVGGLVGANTDAIAQAYATGAVNGSNGGLVGGTFGGTLADGYYDIQTTGQTSDGGGATGLTTAQLQGTGMPTGFSLGSAFSGGAAGGQAGVYPYLVSFFPNGVQALTTTASGAAGASAAGGQVAFYANGGALGQGTASVGANGYVYQAVAAGTVAAGSALGATLTLPGAMAVGGLSFTDAPAVSGAVIAGAPLTAGVLAATTAQTTYSGLLGELNLTFGAADYQAAATSLVAADLDITADGGFTVDQPISGAGSATIAAGGALTTTAPVTSTAGNVALASTGGDLTLDGAVSAAGGVVSLTSSGAIVASAPVAAQTLTGSAVEAASFTQGQIATLGSFTAGAGLTLVDLADLTVAGQVDGGSTSTLTTTGTMTLAPGSSVSALGPVTLLAGRDIDVSGAIISTGGRPVRLNADTAVAGAGTVNFDPGASVTTGGPVTILYNPGTYGGSSATTRAGNPFSADISGGGVQTIRMLVDTPAQLQGVGAELDGLYQLNAGLQLSGTFTPIGSVAAPFTGLLDGLSLAIDGLRVDRLTPTGAGLFGAVGASGVVQNLVLTNVNVTGSGYTGGLVGDLSGSLSNVTIDFGSVTGLGGTGGLVGVAEAGSSIVGSTTFVTVASSAGNDVGGLAGANFGSITGSEAGGPVTASIGSHVGGLIGSNYGMISNDQATGAVQGAEYVGGLVGLNYGTVSGAATGSVGGTEYVGGLVGWNDTAGTISDSTASGVVSASTPAGLAVLGAGDYAGGLVGVNKGAVSNVSASTGTVAGVDDVGGLVGLNQGVLGGSASMTLSAAGAVSGRNAVGGLVGWNDTGASVTNASASGAVTASGNYGGGLVGVNYGTVTGGTATGAVMGAAYTGGFAGWNATGGAISGATASGATVSGSEYVGGFAGWQSVASLKSDTATGAVTDTGDYAGGLVGVNQGGVSGSLALGSSVSGVNIVGGLVGLNQGLIGSGDASGQVSADVSTAAVSGSTMLGGLVGYNDRNGAINIAYATGAVTGASSVSGNDYSGGLVGVNYGTITNTYATGQVSGTNVVGGLVGTNQAGGSVTTSYTTGKVTATGAAVGGVLGVNAGEVSYVYGFPALSGQAVQTAYQAPTASGQPTALSTSQEDDPSAYVGFDFTNTWQANPDGPPTLKDAPTPPAP